MGVVDLRDSKMISLPQGKIFPESIVNQLFL